MRTEKLENKIREFVIRYMNPEKFGGGRVFLVHGNEAREYPDPGSARSAALSLPGISIIIQVPNRMKQVNTSQYSSDSIRKRTLHDLI
ncbi:hypothetical protein [Vulcanisaeta souniana]|uniref:hypothetical protein n=1 Tax=Vulcanisaeta souniana TaxID=164452 RepID=UPI001FB4F8CE|nr:hypothetical protein [Vulcanisaeta souniana]